MTNHIISKKILNTIKEKKILPKPRWEFVLKNYFVWSIGILALIVGSLAFSVIIYMSKYNDWDVYQSIESNLVKFILMTLPYFWLICLILFIIVAFYNFKHTKKGYRFNLTTIIIAIISISLLSGVLLYNFGLGHAIDKLSTERLPFYEKLMNNRRAIWQNPNKGFLICEVIEVVDDKNIITEDPTGNIWNIIIKDTLPNFSNIIQKGDKVKIIGEKQNDNLFYAKMIMPVRPPMETWFNARRPMPHDNIKNKLEMINQLEKDKKEIGKICENNNDCRVPFFYAIRSDCPYESKCIDNKCTVLCPWTGPNIINAPCEQTSDCDCSNYLLNNKGECICFEKKCAIVIDK